MARLTKLTRDAAKEVILKHFRRRRERPIYVGVAACLVGWGLKDTAAVFAELEAEKLIRRPSEDERRQHDIEADDAAFIYTAGASTR